MNEAVWELRDDLVRHEQWYGRFASDVHTLIERGDAEADDLLDEVAVARADLDGLWVDWERLAGREHASIDWPVIGRVTIARRTGPRARGAGRPQGRRPARSRAGPDGELPGEGDDGPLARLGRAVRRAWRQR